jgi:type VI secretion system protein ImpC
LAAPARRTLLRSRYPTGRRSAPDDNAPAAYKAEKPLREARIEVTEVAGKPGVYKAVAFLRPHFQLDELSVSLRLVAELPQSSRK